MNLLKKKKEKDELKVRKNEIQTIPVRDLKEYLIKDFQQIQENEITISHLKDRIEELEKIELKYKATLITLEEFDTRTGREKEKIIKLEEKINNYKEEIKNLTEQKNDCIIREKQALEKVNNVRKNVINDYKEKLVTYINSRKGTLSKKRICEIIESELFFDDEI